jgi:hypothetical protein
VNVWQKSPKPDRGDLFRRNQQAPWVESSDPKMDASWVTVVRFEIAEFKQLHGCGKAAVR